MASRFRVTVSLLAGVMAVLVPVTPVLAGINVVEATGTRTLISHGRIKIVSGKGPLSFSIDVRGSRLWLANSESRRFWEGTVDEYCEGLRQIPGASTPGTSAARAPEQVLVQSTDDVAWIAGLPARRFVVLVDGRHYEDVWLSPDLALADEVSIDRAAETFGLMLGCLASVAQGAGGAVEATPGYTRIYRLGWPLKRATYGPAPPGGTAQATPTMLVTKIAHEEIPESEFVAPAGYEHATLPDVLGVGRRP
jgi:hypothetical protein